MTLIDDDELERQTGIPTATLAQWRYLGKGPAYVRLGRHVRYVQADVDAWISAQRRGGAE